jgi:membrane-associated protease RseP (regulator of RpoE activity)
MKIIPYVLVSTFLALLIHELGHLTAARCCNVKATEIGFGIGRRVFKSTIRGFSYSLRLLPLGSFVMLDGSQLKQKSIPAQMFVHLGGVIFNLITGLLTYGTVFSWLNLLVAAGNVLPLYQHDGWKCGVVIMRALLRRKSQPAELVFTFSGGFVSLLIVWFVIRVFI